MAEENSNKRIARNTILLYTRSLINLVIGLYTSRLTLDALGIADYGFTTSSAVWWRSSACSTAV